MKCPNCYNQQVEFEYVDGEDNPTLRCDKCGMIWKSTVEGVQVIRMGMRVIFG